MDLAHISGSISTERKEILSVIAQEWSTLEDIRIGKSDACASIETTGRPSYLEGKTKASIAW